MPVEEMMRTLDYLREVQARAREVGESPTPIEEEVLVEVSDRPREVEYRCRHCGRSYTLTAEEVEIRERTGIGLDDMCPRCMSGAYHVCADCGRLIRRSRDNYYHVEYDGDTRNTQIVCQDCRSSYYMECIDCNRVLPIDWEEIENNNGRCNDCHERFVDRNDPSRPQVHEWNYKCEPIFHNLESDKFVMGTGTRQYFGVELEYNYLETNKRELCVELQEHHDNTVFYAKNDGSLKEGVEVVSHPCTLGFHKLLDYDKLFRKVRECTTDSGMVDADNCGLHMHVNRASLGATETERELVIAKILLLFDNLWESYFRVFSRRPYADNLSQYANKNCYLNKDGSPLNREENITDFDLGIAYARTDKSDRYVAVNLANRKTIEFRFPQTTLERDVVIANIEMLHHVIAFVKNHSVRKVKNTKDWKVIFTGRIVGAELKTYHKRYFN